MQENAAVLQRRGLPGEQEVAEHLMEAVAPLLIPEDEGVGFAGGLHRRGGVWIVQHIVQHLLGKGVQYRHLRQ